PFHPRSEMSEPSRIGHRDKECGLGILQGVQFVGLPVFVTWVIPHLVAVLAVHHTDTRDESPDVRPVPGLVDEIPVREFLPECNVRARASASSRVIARPSGEGISTRM